jgi:hypothetical protein
LKSIFVTFLLAASFAAAQATAVVVPPAPFFSALGNPATVEATYYKSVGTASVTTFNVQCPSPSQNAISSNPTAGIQTGDAVTQSVICPAGFYVAYVYMENASGTSGGGSVTNTLGFHSTATAQTANVATTLTCSTGDFEQGSYPFWSDGTANITFATAVSSTCSYNAALVLVRIF